MAVKSPYHAQKSAGASQKQPICKPGRRKRRSKNEPVLMVYRVLNKLLFDKNCHIYNSYQKGAIFYQSHKVFYTTGDFLFCQGTDDYLLTQRRSPVVQYQDRILRRSFGHI